MVGVVAFIALATTVTLSLARGAGPELARYEPPDRVAGPPTAKLGKTVFEAKCSACHTTDGASRVGPSFQHRWGSDVALADGSRVTFDETYVRESLANPQAKARPGFPASMPSFDGMLKEREILGLVEYLKSL